MGGIEPPSLTAKDPVRHKLVFWAPFGESLQPGVQQQSSGTSSWVEVAHGIGRYRTVQIREYGTTIDVIEPIWEWPFSNLSLERAKWLPKPVDTVEVVDVAYNRVADEVLALVYERKHAQRIEDARLEVYRADGSPPRYALDLPDDLTTTFSLNPYSDLTSSPTGNTYVLDDYQDLALAYDEQLSPLGTIPVAPDTRRIAGGPAGTLFALREPGYVERYQSDGSITARFDGRPFSASDPSTLRAIAADARGNVYTADGLSSIVSVFAAGGDNPDRPPVPSGPTCEFATDKTVDPVRVVLGDCTEVLLTIDGRCGVGEEPADIMLVVLYYPQLQYRLQMPGQADPATAIVRELRRLVSRIDLRKHRVGLVAYWGGAEVVQALTHDRATLLRAIQKVPRRWPGRCSRRLGTNGYEAGFNCPIVPRVREGIELAQDQFEVVGSGRNVMLLYQPDYCNRQIEHYAYYCRGYVEAEEEAELARGAGTQIVVFDGNRTDYRKYRFNASLYLNDAQPLASSDEDVTLAYDGAQQRLVDYRVPDDPIRDLTLIDELPTNMRLVPGTLRPAGSSTGNTVSWDLVRAGYGLNTFALEVEPLALGRWPTNTKAEADLVDGWGVQRHLSFPVPEVEVIAGTATPPPPTPTPIPTTEPTPTVPSVPGVVYLPIAYRSECFPSHMLVNAVLVIDASTSMEEPTAGGRPKLAAAKDGAKSFVASMRPADRTAVVAFNETAHLVAELTNDTVALSSAIDGISVAPWTRLDRALDAAASELAGPRRQEGSRPVLVLLTDGRQSQTDNDVVREAAARARMPGTVIFTIGVGSDVDAALLIEVAGDPSRYYAAADAEALPEIYRLISESIPCP